MKKHFIALLFFLVLFSCCFADGSIMLPPDYTKSVFMPEQKAAILWDGSKEQMIIESKITVEDIASLAWLIPIESSTKPVVETADEQIFFDLADLFRVRPKSRGLNFGMLGGTAGHEGGVEVLEQLKLDIYDITILRATDEMALIDWLNENGYSFPTAFPSLLSNYVKSGSFYFVANKINLQNKYPGLQPTSQDFECAQQISDYEELRYWYLRGKDQLELQLEYVMEDESECNGANKESVAVLVSLRLGIATPLKISFTPSEPFYPMAISSINVGQGDAKLYFVGKQPFKDSSGLFNTQNMLQVGSGYLSEYGISQGDYITLLGWQGNYYSLDKDSFFAETAFDPTLDPNYEPPVSIWVLIGQFLAVFLLLLLFIGLPLTFFLIAIPFVVGFLMGLAFEEKGNKKSMLRGNRALAVIAVMALLFVLGPLVLLLSVMLFGMYSAPDIYEYEVLYLLLSLLSLLGPYYASMACGLFFKRSGYKKKWILGPVLVFIYLCLLIIVLLKIFGSPF